MKPDDTTLAPFTAPWAMGDPRSQPDGNYVFVSYKSEDRDRVGPIVDGLRQRGIPVWWDHDGIPIGAPWAETIKLRLDGAKVVVVIWSKRSVGPEGSFVREEARTAIRLQRLVPVKTDEVDPPLGFGEVQAIDLSKWNGRATDPQFERLVRDLGAKLDVIVLPPPAPPPPWHIRFLRKYGITLASAAVLSVVGWLTYSIIRGPTAADLYARLSDRDPPKVNERAAALRALASRKDTIDPARLTENHRQVVQFLAWRAKRPPLLACDAPEATRAAAELLGAPDVTEAVAYLRSRMRLQSPRGELSLDSVNLQKQNFSGADLRHTTFKFACLDGANFTDARLIGSDFDSAHVSKSSFSRARADSAKFGMSKLTGTNWFNACLRHANFTGADLSDADLSRAAISWADFSDAQGRVQSGWTVIDMTFAANARFVGTKDLLREERDLLERAGATFTEDPKVWDARRAHAATEVGSRACRPLS